MHSLVLPYIMICLLLINLITLFSSFNFTTNFEIAISKFQNGYNTEAFDLLKKASATNDVFAQYYLAQCYEFGIGTTVDLQLAYTYYRRAAERGFTPAMRELSRCYKDGLGITPNSTKSQEWQGRYNKKFTGEELPSILSFYKKGETKTLLSNNDIKDLNENKTNDYNINLHQNEVNNNKRINGILNKKDSILHNTHIISDVDIDIPLNKTNSNTSTFAVIIANENYHFVSKVPYAERDGEILEQYLTKAVGLPQDHIKTYKNASFGNMAAALKHIENLSEAFGKDLNLIFYYAGHGMPNEKTKNPMLIPIDGDAAIPETCYDLDKLISTLGGLNAKSVVVMLDACFSGTERGNNMLMAARGIRIKSNQSEPIGNMVIFSASQGDETAYPYNTEQHGLFTFFLLKKLQENKGDVTLGELSDYITEQVKRQSVVSNGKLQTPTVAVSPTIKDSWRNLKIR